MSARCPRSHRDRGRGWRQRGRPGFIWRAGFLFAPLAIFSVIGLSRLLSWLLDRSGVFGDARPFPFPIIVPLALAVLLFLAAMRRVGGPLSEVVDAAERVAEGDFGVRVRAHGPPWIRALGHAFNSMTGRLERHQQQRRQLMADVAHELRTPLTVMQGRLEGMIDGIYPAGADNISLILDETRHLARLVEDLRTLAHSEGGTLSLQREPTDMSVLLGEAVAAFRVEADRRQVHLRLAIADDLPILTVDPIRIREVIANLIANALQYTPPSGDVSISGRPVGQTLIIEIADSGPGISPEELPHVFDRHFKGDASRGSGLGLAIARGLVQSHGGTLTAQSEPGRGTTMTVRLPL